MAMKVIKAVALITAIAMALTIAHTMKNMQLQEENNHATPSVEASSSSSSSSSSALEKLTLPQTKRASRFLVEAANNPRTPYGYGSHSQYCPKNNNACLGHSGHKLNNTCCNHKCTDLLTDRANCNECKRKCKFDNSCCNGGCVNLAYDMHNCGKCGNKCKHGHRCIYGMCNYA